MSNTGEGVKPTHENLLAELMILSGMIAGLSDGRIRVAVSEEDETKAQQLEAAHFLKLDEKRLGRDIEVYGFMGKVAGDGVALVDYLTEVVTPLKGEIPATYDAVAPLVEQLGYHLLDAAHHEAWGEIFVASEQHSYCVSLRRRTV